MIQLKFVTALASATFLSFAAQAAVSTPQRLPLDKPTSINNIGLDCTGIGTDDREHSRVKNYSVRLETIGGYRQYLANEDITLRNRQGQQLLNVRCDAPWLMIKLDPGRYGASVEIPGAAPKNVWFAASERGLRNVYVHFPSKIDGQEHRMTRPAHDGKENEEHKQQS
jgi:hypothetical protein